MTRKTQIVIIAVMAALFMMASPACAQDLSTENQVIFGFKITAGGRYDNVRMCVATPSGTKGGPAMDISAFAEVGLRDNVSLLVNIPVMRPILFGVAFQMLQFEPEVALLFRKVNDGKVDLVAGPSLGIIFHYGPDYESSNSGNDRGPSFFAMGPKIGGYLGVDFKRDKETFNMQLGVSPYVSPLFGINDPDEHKGVVVGGTLDGVFRFK
jgi:hypothetical protein